MQKVLDRLKLLRDELESTSFLGWSQVEIWGNRALPTIAKHCSEHLNEFKNLLKKPTYSASPRIIVSRPDLDDARYIFSPERYEKEYKKWLVSKMENEQQSVVEAAVYRQSCENADRKILAFFDGIIQEMEDSVAVMTTSTYTPDYVNLQRIDELRSIKNTLFDLSKLIRICEELNLCFSNDSYFSTLMLVRSILDHVPPIFGCKTFPEVANSYNGGSSFKEAMQRLEKSARKLADAYLHLQVRSSESLPNHTQVNFNSELDFLLGEVYRILK
ncbi:MAG: hypothetical protein AAFX01_00390 [Cyanobacteria bacterium J06638_28]